MAKTQIHISVDVKDHETMRILCGRLRPYLTISDLVRYAIEKELAQYDEDDLAQYAEIARLDDKPIGYDDV